MEKQRRNSESQRGDAETNTSFTLREKILLLSGVQIEIKSSSIFLWNPSCWHSKGQKTHVLTAFETCRVFATRPRMCLCVCLSVRILFRLLFPTSPFPLPLLLCLD